MIGGIANQFGDSEVQQLGYAIGGDQDIAGLQVAVHHQVAMRIRHGVADGTEQREPFGHRQTPPGGVVVDGNAVDILHHQIWQPVPGDAAIQQPGNDGMLQVCQNLPLATEAAHCFTIHSAERNHFNRHLFTELLVIALCQVHDAHPAYPQARENAVRAQPFDGQFRIGGQIARLHVQRRSVQKLLAHRLRGLLQAGFRLHRAAPGRRRSGPPDTPSAGPHRAR